MSIWTILFVVLPIAWIGGFTVFHVAGGLIHLLLVLAVISLILHFVMGTWTTSRSLNRNPSDSTAEFMAERRQEQRARKDLTVQMSGRAANGDAFSQSVIASNISNGGALLSGLSSAVRSGDLVWVEYQGRMARYRIVWVRDSDSDLKSQAAVQKLDTEECPWAISGTVSR